MNNLIKIEKAIKEDILQILDIYNYYINFGLANFEEEEMSYDEFFDLYKSIIKLDLPFLVAKKDDKIIGFVYLNKFRTKNLFNIHFSLLPKYRGCHTNFLQVYHGEKYSGVTLHKINNGIDEGDIIDQKKFMIKLNDTAYDNYFKLMKCSVLVFKKNINKIIKSKYNTKKQKLSSGHYYTRGSVDYKKISKFNMKKPTLKIHNKIRSLIFPPFQIPVVNGIRVKKSLYKKNKIYLIESFSNKFKNS